MTTAQDWISRLKLVEHDPPCMGHFKEIYRSDIMVKDIKGKDVSSCSSIYFLQKRGEHGFFNQISTSDELFVYNAGAPLTVLYFDQTVTPKLVNKVLGPGLKS